MKLTVGNADIRTPSADSRGKRVEWRRLRSIADLPPGFWNDKIAGGSIGKNESLIKLYEQHIHGVDHVYFVASSRNRIVGFALFTIYFKDLIEHLPVLLADLLETARSVFPNLFYWIEAAAGMNDTDGQHWWYDTSFWSWDVFFSELYKQISLYKNKVRSIVFRCYNEQELTDEVVSLYNNRFFCMVDELPGTRITFEKIYQTPEEYLGSLKKRDRYTIRKALKRCREHGLEFEEEPGGADIWDALYPLYLETSERSKDLFSEPLPKAFFVSLSAEPSLCPCIQVIKNANGKIISFALSLENENGLHPFVIGMDYAVNKDLYLIYTTYWLFILRAVSRGHRMINMGGTTEFVKQRFGAKIVPAKIFVRLRNPVMNYLLRPLIQRYY